MKRRKTEIKIRLCKEEEEKTKKMGETLIDGYILTRFPALRMRKPSEDKPKTWKQTKKI